MSKTVTTRALQVIQAKGIPLYTFFLRGDQILEVAEISRIKKSDDGNLLGYQRGEVSQHVAEIADYLRSGDVIFPNAILLAMSSEVKFKQSRGPKVGGGECLPGVLELPVKNGKSKVAWIVDGQQRTLALNRAGKRDMLVPVTGFVTDDFEIHRSQFLLVNKVKPLPKGLINELLPRVNTALPPSLAKNKIPSAICELLNRDPESPFKGLIIRQTTDRKTAKEAVVADNSLLHVIRTSLNTPHGCLYQYRNVASNEIDVDAVRYCLNLFWSEVKKVFPKAWGKAPTRSRLMHGAGIKAMGVVMDRVMGNVRAEDPKAVAHIRSCLEKLKPVCAWTEGTWDIIDGRPWNGIQNTATDVRLLSNALVRTYTQVDEG